MECTYGVTLEELLKRPTWALALNGADDNDGKQGEPDADEDEDEDDEDEDPDDKDSEGKSKKAAPGDPVKLQAKIDTLLKERIANTKKRSDLNTKLTTANARILELEANGTKDEDLKRQVTEGAATAASLTAANTQLRRENAFLKDNSQTWVDPEAALALVSWKDVELDDDGTAVGLDDAITQLVEKKPWLVKAAEPEPTKKTPPPKKTGDQPGDKKNKGDAQSAADKEKLYQKYPGLRR